MSRFQSPLDSELPYCPRSDKFSFRSRREARAQMRRWQGRGRGFHGQRVYHCEDCGNWHITSQVRP